MKKLIFLLLLLVPLQSLATDWYVDSSNNGGTENGTSWATAWGTFADINWTSVQPGDTVYISGGSTTKTYHETLTVGRSGTAGNPVTIRPGQDANHNGTVIITGDSTRDDGIIANQNYITINGEYNGLRHLDIDNTAYRAIRGWPASNMIVLYVNIHDIGLPYEYPEVYATSEFFRQFWTEQYLLQAFLIFNAKFEIILAMNYLMTDHLPAFKKAFSLYDPKKHPYISGSFYLRRK